MGIGVGYLMAGEPTLALEHGFELARLPEGPGISAGTLAYLMGVAQEAAGGEVRQRALDSYAQAARATEATLWQDDGPRVAPLAAARLLGSR
jgi:hypothetical protein